MKALRYEDENLGVSDVPRPVANGEALVRVTLSGICNTDLEIARGYAGFQGTLGHEFVGMIESVSEARASARAFSPNEPSLSTTPRGMPARGPRSASGSDTTAWSHSKQSHRLRMKYRP